MVRGAGNAYTVSWRLAVSWTDFKQSMPSLLQASMYVYRTTLCLVRLPVYKGVGLSRLILFRLACATSEQVRTRFEVTT